jgi:hyperosmotically inducible periplasmic protein
MFVLAGYGAAAAQQQPGTAERIGEKIDRGLSQLGAELSEAWADVRRGVEKMGVEGRVYGRLHWDKALDGAKLDIGVRESNTVVLSGSVRTDVARQKAEQLARDTVGVSNVVNQLTVAPQTP